MTSVRGLTDIIGPGLDILFVGINPGTLSAQVGHHFARNTNRFYRALFEAGLTPRLYAPEEDAGLLEIGIGVTNIATRSTGMARELKMSDYEEGREPLRRKVRTYRPLIVAFTGRMAATGYYGKPGPLGPREEGIEGARVFVAPSPSAANKAHHPDANLFAWYARLREFRDELRQQRDAGRGGEG